MFFRRAAFIQGRDLAEGQILGETGRRAAFAGAGEQRQKGSTGRFGTHSAAAEVTGNCRAAESLLDQWLVLLDVAQQNGDAVEGRALLGECADAAGDFDALEAFAGRGEKQIGIGRRGGRLFR